MTLAPLTSLGLVSSHTNLLATGQRRYAIKFVRSRAAAKTSEETWLRSSYPLQSVAIYANRIPAPGAAIAAISLAAFGCASPLAASLIRANRAASPNND